MEQIDRTFCDNVFDFENANLPKKKLRHKLEQLMPEFAKFVENSNIPGYKDKNFRILTALLTEPSKREGLSTDGLQFLYMRLVLGTEEDITKINMRSYDDEADMKSYRLLLKIHDENDYLFQAISNMAHLLSRSETSNKWHDYEDNGKENLIKKITEDINNCYRRFDNELLYKGVPVRKRTVCSRTRCNVVFSTPYIYPVLPLLFVLNAIYKVKGDGNKHDKAELLKYNTSCSLTDNVYETFAISEAAEHLLERVEDVLIKHLVLYKRTVFPIRKDCYEDFDYQESKRNESTLFNRRIAFAFPFCRVRKLAADIVKECSLDDRQAAELTRNLPKYLLNKTYGESKIEEKYGKKTLDIIKGFRILADPTTYYQDKKLTEIYKVDVWSKLKVSTKKMFVNPDADSKITRKGCMVSLESISSIFLCRNIFSFIQHRITRCMGRNGCCLNITESWFMSLKITVEKMNTRIEKKCSRISNGKTLRKCVQV